jgi:hypothetical protein
MEKQSLVDVFVCTLALIITGIIFFYQSLFPRNVVCGSNSTGQSDGTCIPLSRVYASTLCYVIHVFLISIWYHTIPCLINANVVVCFLIQSSNAESWLLPIEVGNSSYLTAQHRDLHSTWVIILQDSKHYFRPFCSFWNTTEHFWNTVF